MKRAVAIFLLVIMVLPPAAQAGQVAARAADAVGAKDTEQKIGRASCRERVFGRV